MNVHKQRVSLRVAMSLLVLFVVIATSGMTVFTHNLVHATPSAASVQLQPKWTYATGGTFVSPGVVYNGRLYVTSAYYVDTYNDYVLVSGIDEATGKVTWQKTLSSSNVTVTPVIYNNNVYVTDGKNIQVFNADNDQLPVVWSKPGGELTLANGVVYAYTGSQVYAYDAVNGNQLWQQNHACSGDAPIVANGLVYLDSCGGNFGDSTVALSTQDGSLKWYQTGTCHNGPIDQIIGTSTFVGNGFVYTKTNSVTNNLCYNHGITAFNAADGTSAWSIIFPGSNPNVFDINVANGIVYVSVVDYSQTFPFTLYAVDGTSGTILWNQPTSGGSSITTTIDNGIVYGVSGIALYAWDAQTGTQVYANANIANLTSNTFLQAPFVVDNTLYLWDTTGVLYAFDIGQQGTPTPTPSPSPSPSPASSPTITLNATSGEPGTNLIVTGSGWTPGDVVDISLSTSVSLLTKATVASDGTFTTSFAVPENAATGSQFVDAKDETTSETAQSSFTVTSSPRGKLFIFIQGINSDLSASDAKTNNIPTNNFSFGQPNGIYSFLLKTYPTAQFRMFSYKGADSKGTPQKYYCQDTFTQHLSVYVSILKAQITSYLTHNPNTGVYLIGHSMGGAVALGLLADMKINGFLNVNGGKVAGVVSLDSPLGGTDPLLGVNSYFTKSNFQGKCPALVPKNKPPLPTFSLDDLFHTFGNGTPHGGVDSIMVVINGGDFSNQEVAAAAANANAPVLTIGNPLDFVYTNDCPLTVSNFPSTQWVADQGNNSGVYGRVFLDDKALLTCTDANNQIAANHFHVFTNPQVENGLQQFIDGQTPNALAVAPNSP